MAHYEKIVLNQVTSHDIGLGNKSPRNSVTRLGDFLKALGANFLSKVAQIFSNNFGLLWKCSFYIKMMWILFGQLLEKIEPLLTPTSGHTGPKDQSSISFSSIRIGTSGENWQWNLQPVLLRNFQLKFTQCSFEHSNWPL